MSAVNPEDFASDTPPVRVMGTESECNIQQPRDGHIPKYYYIGADALSAADINAITTVSKDWVSSYLGGEGEAGRLYTDLGNLEFATRECFGPAAAAVADGNGVDILSRVVLASDCAHNGLYRTSGTHMRSRAVEADTDYFIDKTNGYHENLMLSRSVACSRIFRMFAATMLACDIESMGGILTKVGFAFSQKVSGIGRSPVTSDIDRRTPHGEKPMMLIPPAVIDDDVLGDPKWARAEVRLADPGASLTTRFLRLAYLTLGVRVVEQKHRFDNLELDNMCVADPIAAAKIFAADISLSRTVSNRKGEQYTALDFKEAILDKIEYLAGNIALPADELLAVHFLRSRLDALRRSNPEEGEYEMEVRARTNFAPRQLFVANGAPVSTLTARSNVQLERNLDWDRILPEGAAQRYEQRIAPKDGLAVKVRELAAKADIVPRAQRRAEMIDGAQEGIVCNWAMYTDAKGQTTSLGDVYGD